MRRIDDLVEREPLYGRLAPGCESNIEALDLGALCARARGRSRTETRRAAASTRSLSAAAKRTNTLLQAKGKTCCRRTRALAAALRGAGAAAGAGDPGIQAQMEGTAKSQAASAGAQAQRDLDAYRKQLEAQDAAQINAAQQTLAARADARSARRPTNSTPKNPRSRCIGERRRRRAPFAAHAALEPALDEPRARTRTSSSPRSIAKRPTRSPPSATGRRELAALQTQLRKGIEPRHDGQVAQIRQRSVQRFPRARRSAAHPVRAGQRPLIGTSPSGVAVKSTRTRRPRCARASPSSTPTTRRPFRTTRNRRSPISRRRGRPDPHGTRS